ncbi:hypothetical protein [Pseudorhodoplanes sinuspersici]|uniref:Uncharacterized protein n=1 Tax=Pseudorhodoplanes sinuspersici TaxID=1235591 RepID=A0A1W6ZLL0_9HYPH|nr:hypothetical protein [Pseudorhodoplanes sinuspersici]ARP98251.1 hypothetical protein CAK95_03455 [Pseudorhodoplanes sinuspersici]RKE65641.1 hypothetical protein DFP91_5886 [Pseudorhodoplanes sinuspersici]
MNAANIKEAIAYAIETADKMPVPNNYADNGYPDAPWLSDWGAFLAERVLYDLSNRGLTIIETPSR